MKRIAFVAFSLVLAGCSTAPRFNVASAPREFESRLEDLAGTWYGESSLPDGGTIEWIMRRSADGKFSIDHRTHQNGMVSVATEAGEWSVVGAFEIVHTRSRIEEGVRSEFASGDPFYWDLYEILELEKDRIVYRNLRSGLIEHYFRKYPGFEFPEGKSRTSPHSQLRGADAPLRG